LLISRDKPHLRLLEVLAKLPACLLPERRTLRVIKQIHSAPAGVEDWAHAAVAGAADRALPVLVNDRLTDRRRGSRDYLLAGASHSD
jgi:hypothetical protein